MPPSILADCLSNYTCSGHFYTAWPVTTYCSFPWFTRIVPDLRFRILYPRGTVQMVKTIFCLRIPRWSRRRWKAKT